MNIFNVLQRATKKQHARQNHAFSKKTRILITEINSFNFCSDTDDELKQSFNHLKAQARSGACTGTLLPEVYAIVKEAVMRTLDLQLFDVQLAAGIELNNGHMVEMQTGEGKTLAAVLSACLNALSGQGVHIFTFNDYLASRDASWMSPVYSFLGLSCAYSGEGMTIAEKRAAYAADITYVTAKEAGFDYLRDAMCYDEKEQVHRPFNYVIVDEADSILIDEARMPLILAGKTTFNTIPPDISPTLIQSINALVTTFSLHTHYDTDEYGRDVFLTDEGIERCQSALNTANLFESRNLPLYNAINCALYAHVILSKDKNYVVIDGHIHIIDSFTGRIAAGRQWQNGIQQAVEMKEGIALSKSDHTVLESITLQSLALLYPRLCGMTATAKSSDVEFCRIYGLETVVMPPQKPCLRLDRPDRLFIHKDEKCKALCDEVIRVHRSGQPNLIGTESVRESDHIFNSLHTAGVACRVINARDDRQEAEIIARAGHLHAVTVSTNMAGRGVDIRLGENDVQHDEIAALGGLYVIGTNRHESMRIDNQLRGRAGRQGDPGSSQFFVSLEDDLLKRFGIHRAVGTKYNNLRKINNNISHIQRIIDGQNTELRHQLSKFTGLMEKQRKLHHAKRMEILHSNMASSRKYAILHILDKYRAAYLEDVSCIRDGIHLMKAAGKNPLDEFHRAIISAYNDMTLQMEAEIALFAEDAPVPVYAPPSELRTYTLIETFDEKFL